ncbi:MAG: hypothetical protein L3J59_14205 [Methylococcaceae bacterium]|nr:hypothetical protein [Methylococcaceae bacterium]
MNKILASILFYIIFSSPIVFSSEVNIQNVFSVDRPFPKKNLFPFYSRDEKEPRISEFELVNQFFLSNANGERQAVVTLYNPALSLRTLLSEHIIAVFANGEKKFPKAVKVNILAKETVTYTLDFGIHQFPILYLYTKIQE